MFIRLPNRPCRLYIRDVWGLEGGQSQSISLPLSVARQTRSENEKGKRDQPKRSSSVSLSRRISHLATDRTEPTKKVRRPSNSIISFLPSFSPLMPEGAKAAAAAKSRGSEEWLAHKKQLRGNRGGRVGSGGAFRTEQRNKPKQTSKLQIYL